MLLLKGYDDRFSSEPLGDSLNSSVLISSSSSSETSCWDMISWWRVRFDSPLRPSLRLTCSSISIYNAIHHYMQWLIRIIGIIAMVTSAFRSPTRSTSSRMRSLSSTILSSPSAMFTSFCNKKTKKQFQINPVHS